MRILKTLSSIFIARIIVNNPQIDKQHCTMRKHRLLLVFLLAVTMCPVVYGQQQSAGNIPSDKKEIIDRFIAANCRNDPPDYCRGTKGAYHDRCRLLRPLTSRHHCQYPRCRQHCSRAIGRRFRPCLPLPHTGPGLPSVYHA